MIKVPGLSSRLSSGSDLSGPALPTGAVSGAGFLRRLAGILSSSGSGAEAFLATGAGLAERPALSASKGRPALAADAVRSGLARVTPRTRSPWLVRSCTISDQAMSSGQVMTWLRSRTAKSSSKKAPSPNSVLPALVSSWRSRLRRVMANTGSVVPLNSIRAMSLLLAVSCVIVVMQ